MPHNICCVPDSIPVCSAFALPHRSQLNRNKNSEVRRRDSAIRETLINFISGSSGATANILVGQPFDTAKTKMQIYPTFYKGMMDSLLQTWRQEKFRGLFSGLLPNCMVNVVEAGVMFVLWPELQIRYAKKEGRHVEDLTVFEKACLGSVAAISSATLMTPFEVIKCRLQVSRENWILHQKVVNSRVINAAETPPMTEVFRNIVQREGYRAFFKGVRCAILRDVIGYFFYIGTYEYCLELMCPVCTRGSGFPFLSVFLSGGVAGWMHYLTCFPVDVVKARIQNSSYHLTAPAVTLSILRDEGFRYFFSGLKPVLIRTFYGSGVFFLVFESMRKHLRGSFMPNSDEAKEKLKKGDGGDGEDDQDG